MKILHIHPTMRSGGIEAIICGLVNEMVKTNDVTVCTIFQPQPSDVFYNKLDPRIKKLSLGKTKFGFSVSEIFKIVNVLRKGHYDVVHVHGCFYYYALAIWLFHKKVKFVYTVHSDANKENLTWDKHFFPIKKYFFMKKYISPVTISPVSQQSFLSLYHCDSTLIYNGIKQPRICLERNIIDEKRITPHTKVFVHPGRITEAKNQLVLCKVFKRLIEEKFDIVLIIAGTNEDRAIFRTLEPYFSDRIQYIGERNDVTDLMSRADAFCLPSVWEGLPVTLLEALSVGCIPICSPVGGIVNVIQPFENGLLSKSSSEQDYYDIMKAFLTMETTTIAQMKKECQKSFGRYEITTTAQSYLEEYRK